MVYSEEPNSKNIFQIEARQAGTINLGGIHLQESPEEKLEKLLRRAEEYSLMPLEETTWRPERLSGCTETVYACDRLTLKLGEFSLQLLCRETIRLGRKLDCNDIIVADLLNARTLRDYPNNSISKTHAQIHYCGDSVNLFDISTNGTFIDGMRPTDKGTEIPREAEVAFGSIRWKMAMQRCEQRPEDPLCINCLARKIRSLVFTRMDSVPEAYLLVWQCCDLGRVRRELEGFMLLRRAGGFLLKTPSGEVVVLVPGRTILFGRGNHLKVEEYRQYGL